MSRVSWVVGAVCMVVAAAHAGEEVELATGKPLPAFELPTLGGGKVQVAELRGRPTVLFFGATWCPYSKRMAVAADALSRDYGERVAVYLVDIREDRATAGGMWREKKKLTLPVLLDDDGAFTTAVAPPAELRGKVSALMSMNARYIVVDAEGRVRHFPYAPGTGSHDWELAHLRAVVDELLVPPAPAKG